MDKLLYFFVVVICLILMYPFVYGIFLVILVTFGSIFDIITGGDAFFMWWMS